MHFNNLRQITRRLFFLEPLKRGYGQLRPVQSGNSELAEKMTLQSLDVSRKLVT